MSIILDALKKSEEERQRHLVPDLHTQQTPARAAQMPPARQGSTMAARAALLIAAMALGLGLYAVFRQSELSGAGDDAQGKTSGVSQPRALPGDIADGAMQRHAGGGAVAPQVRSPNEPTAQTSGSSPLVRPIPKVAQPGPGQTAGSQAIADENARMAPPQPLIESTERTDQTRRVVSDKTTAPATVAGKVTQSDGSGPIRSPSVRVPGAAGSTKPASLSSASPATPTLPAQAAVGRVEPKANVRGEVSDRAPAAKESPEGLKLSLSPELESLKRDLLALKRELASPDASSSTRLPFEPDSKPRLDLGQALDSDSNVPAARPNTETSTERSTKAAADVAGLGYQARRQSLPAASSPANRASVSTAEFDPFLSPTLARQYPIAVHRYSEIPAERFVIIKGERFAEGDRLDTEWRLARISRAAVTLDNGKQRVRLAIR